MVPEGGMYHPRGKGKERKTGKAHIITHSKENVQI